MPFVGAALSFVGGALGVGAGAAFAAGSMAAWTAGAAFAGTAFGAVTVKLLTSVAVSALATAIAGKPEVKEAGIRTSTTMSGGTNPEGFILGTYATSGAMVCPPLSHGSSGKTPNAYLNYVIEVGGKPGQELAGLIVDGEYADILTANPHPDYGQRLGGRFEGRAWIRYYDGSQTGADPMLLSKYAPPYVRPWSADMVGAGICYAVLTFKFDREVFHGWPSVKFILRGLPTYDPRLDSTAGGSGPQRWGNPATWAYSDNPAVLIYNILRGVSLDQHIWGGSATADDLPYPIWAEAMDACDTLVSDGAGGQMRQYRAGFEVFAEDEPFSIIEELLTACAGSLSEHGGIWKLRCGAPGLPVAFISDDDIIISETQDFEPFPSPESIYNGITGSYPDPDSLWETREADPIFSAEWEAEDGDRRLPADVAFSAVWDPVQVQHLMGALIKDHRRMRVHVITLPPEAGALEPGDVISWTSAANFYSAKLFEVKASIRDPRIGNARISLREVDPADYDPPAGIVRPSPPDLLPALPAPQVVPGWAVSPHVLEDAEGDPRRPAIRASWDPEAADDARGVRVQVRAPGDGEIHELPLSDVEAGEAVYDGVIPGEVYQMRGRIAAGRPTVWTDWLSATAPDVRVGEKDITPELAETIDQAQQDAQQAAQDAADAKAETEGLREYVDDTVDQAKTDMAVDYAAAQQAASDAIDAAQDAGDFASDALQAAQDAEGYAQDAAASAGDTLALVHSGIFPGFMAIPEERVKAFGTNAPPGLPQDFDTSLVSWAHYGSDESGPYIEMDASTGHRYIRTRGLVDVHEDSVVEVVMRVQVSEPMDLQIRPYFILPDGTSPANYNHNFRDFPADGIVELRAVFARQAGGNIDFTGGSASLWSDCAGIRWSIKNNEAYPGAFYRIYSVQVRDLTSKQFAHYASVSEGIATQAAADAEGFTAQAETFRDEAAISSTDAGSAASAAAISAGVATSAKDDAETAATDAESYRTDAATSASSAAGSASAASQSAGVATSAKDDAEQAASASASSASAASSSAAAAGQSAGAAQTARTAAETARGQAETYRDDAAGSASSASGDAAAASQSAGVAASARDDAGGYASAASSSASTATSAASAAGQSASAAQTAQTGAETASSQAEGYRDESVTAADSAAGSAAQAAISEGLAVSAADSAVRTTRDTLPTTFENPDYWARRAGASPDNIAPVSDRWEFTTDNDVPVVRMNDITNNASIATAHHVMQRGVRTAVEGDTVRIEARVRTGGSGGASEPGVALRWSWL